MISSIRNTFNQAFTDQKYQKMLASISKMNNGKMDFRLAETPVFIDRTTKNKLVKAGDEICAFITSDTFKTKTENSFSKVATPPNESNLPSCIVMDFAICRNAQNEIEPKLIELQGFPSLFGLEVFHDRAFRNSFEIPAGFSPYLNGINDKSYLQLLKKVILDEEYKHTILLELYPHEQKTRVDFYCTQKLIEIPIVCLSEILVEGNELFYEQGGNKKRIDRIYNRIVWDEIEKQSEAMKEKAELLLQDLKIEWVTHPNHFYRISKYIMPYLKSEAVPTTRFLNEITNIPTDLENYVLKPLFSFAGQGVIIDVNENDIKVIKDPENWILQEKVTYAPIIDTPTGAAKTEIRLFYFLDNVSNQYKAVLNLARLSKGKMIGVSYNADKDWVGGTLAYFEI
ncbi:MAG: hypothetical protein RIR55_1073 [Bacteroidota bacterium]